jgi:O-antigen ligase
MPLVNHPFWSRFVGELTITKFVGVGCLIYAIWHCLARRSFPRVLGSWVVRLFLLFYLLAVASYFSMGYQGDWKSSSLFSYTSFLSLLFVTAAVVDAQLRLRRTLFVAIGSMAFASLYVIREWQVYHHLYDGYRPGFISGDPNYFTLSAVVCLPVAYYLMLDAHSRWSKAFCLVCMALTFVAVTLAASRGGFAGLVCVILIVLWRSPRRIRNFVLISTIAVPLLLFAPTSPLHRFLHPDYGDQEGESSRLELWRAGWQMIQQKPFTGVGLGNFKRLVTRYEGDEVDLQKIAHNTYIEVAAEMGIPSLLVFVGILFSVYRSLARVRKRATNPSFYFSTALAMQAALLGCVVAIMFISCEKQKILWFLVFLTPCLESLANAEEPEKALEHQPVYEYSKEDGNYDLDPQGQEVARWS